MLSSIVATNVFFQKTGNFLSHFFHVLASYEGISGQHLKYNANHQLKRI